MEIQEKRLAERIKVLAGLSATPGSGVTRFSYSDLDRKAREYIREECRKIGMEMLEDEVGNIRAIYRGQDDSLAPVWVGSHIDSVRNGGRYDGIVGVVSALEVLTVFYENGYKPVRPVELVIFAEEEGSNFGTTMIGSKALVGKCDKAYLEKLKTENGVTAYDLIKEAGFAPEDVDKCRLSDKDVHAMLEMHIEQGIVLDREGLTIGVVQAIAGMHTYRIAVHGESNHAGATPMPMRHDPMMAAANLIAEIEKYTKQEVYDTTVATVGEIECAPNMPNVIPQKVQFSVDIRDVREDGIASVVSFIRKRCEDMENELGVTFEITTVGTSKCIGLSQRIADMIEESTKEKGFSYKCMNSGAVHDSAMLTEVTEVGMIFVPSVNGKSHNPEEYTESEDIRKGAEVLLDVVKKLAV